MPGGKERAAPQEITRPKLLVVEGRTPFIFFNSLLGHLALNDIQVEDFRGNADLSTFVRTLSVTPGFRNLTSLGIIRDAEDDAAAAFDSGSNAIERIGLPKPDQAGAVRESRPRTGVFILPDNRSAGMLEDLCLRAVEADPAMPCVQDFITCAERQLGQVPQQAKARVHAFLATRPESEGQVGRAAQRGYWPWNNSAFDELRQFLQAL